jgi:malate/lactate dehydrogenase
VWIGRGCSDRRPKRWRRARARCARSPPTDRRADVALSLVGNPPGQTVLLWEHATVGGIALTSLLAEPERNASLDGIAAAWPPGPYALASCGGRRDRRDVGSERDARSPVSSVPTTSMGERTRTVALPVRLGAAGIERVMLPELSAEERGGAGERVALI